MALKYSVDEVIQYLDTQWDYLLHTRSLIPYTKECVSGAYKIATAPYYRDKGYNVTVTFPEGLSQEKIDKINYIGYWVNQGFIIRLVAYLEYCNVFTPSDVTPKIKIDFDVKGGDEIDVARRLRNYFVHSSGYYNPNNSKHKKTYEKLIELFNLNPNVYQEQGGGFFPIPINEVLEPMVKRCKIYIKDKYGVDS